MGDSHEETSCPVSPNEPNNITPGPEWTKQEIDFITRLSANARMLYYLLQQGAVTYERRTRLFGVLIALSAVVQTSINGIFATAESTGPINVSTTRYVLTCVAFSMGVIVTALGAVQHVLKYNTRSNQARVAANIFREIQEEIAKELFRDAKGRRDFQEFTIHIYGKWDVACKTRPIMSMQTQDGHTISQLEMIPVDVIQT